MGDLLSPEPTQDEQMQADFEAQTKRDIQSLTCELRDERREREDKLVGGLLSQLVAALMTSDKPPFKTASANPIYLASRYGTPTLKIEVAGFVYSLQLSLDEQPTETVTQEAERLYNEGRRPLRDRDY